MNSSGKTLALVQTCVRHFGKSAARRSVAQTEVVSNKFAKLKDSQKAFGIEDHVPVYIKGGFGDKLIFGISAGLTLIGLGMSTETLYKLSFK